MGQIHLANAKGTASRREDFHHRPLELAVPQAAGLVEVSRASWAICPHSRDLPV